MRLFSLTIVIVLFLTRVPSAYTHRCSQRDQSSLLQLKRGLVYFCQWPGKLRTWNSTSDCCAWGGVTCSRRGDVIGLDLSLEFISGGIDDSDSPMFDLLHLQRLDLSQNSFYGLRIPSGIGKLVNLLHLNLYGSGFGGQVPIEISGLTSLLTLDLSDGYSPNSPDPIRLEDPKFSTLVENLTNLVELNLGGVNMSSEGEGHRWGHALATSLPNLQALKLARCSLSGPLHDSLGKLQALTSVDLSGNKLLSGTLPEFIGNMTKLESLKLFDCGFSGSITHIRWENLMNLVELYLSSNVLNGSIPLSLFSLPSIQRLYLRSNQFSGQLGEVENSANLSHLDLASNKLEGPVPKFIPNLGSLEYLQLSYNNFSGTAISRYLNF